MPDSTAVVQGISIQHEEVSPFPRFHSPKFFGLAPGFRAPTGSGLNNLHGRQSDLAEHTHLEVKRQAGSSGPGSGAGVVARDDFSTLIDKLLYKQAGALVALLSTSQILTSSSAMVR